MSDYGDQLRQQLPVTGGGTVTGLMAERRALCGSCEEAWWTWLMDYRPPIMPVLVQVAKATPDRVVDSRRVRRQKWLETVRFQQRLTADICRRHHQHVGGLA